jgi:hypothetical protein
VVSEKDSNAILKCSDFSQSSTFTEVTECDQTESDQKRHYALLESDKALFGMR